MAKGSFNGVISGKKGNTVFYPIKNSNNAEKQGWREYNAKVSNPQTDGQIDQRVKLQAVNNLYRALKSVIGRGFENHKYGDESRRAFLKLALSADFSSGPILSKGSTIAAPIPGVPIMYGSLPPVGVLWDDDNVTMKTTLQAEGQTYDTIGGLSQLFVANGYKLGDQVTFVWGDFGLTVLSIAAGGGLEYTPTYRVFDFFIDVTDTRSVEDAIGINFQEIDGELAVDGTMFSLQAIENMVLAISVSRDGETSNLRSAAYFAIGSGVADNIYNLSAAEVAARKQSYRKKTTSNTNWEQVPGGEGGGGGSTVTAFTLSGTEIVPGSITNVAAEPAEIVDANGQRYFVRAHTSAGGTRYLYGQGGGDFTSSATAPTGATNANTIDPCAANNIASGCRAWLLAKGVSADLLLTT